MKKSYITVPIVLAVSLVLVLSLTFALFTETVNGTRTFTLANFTSDVVVSFNGTAAAPSGTTVGGAKYYDVSLNSTDANYIGKLRVSVKYNGNGVGLMRVRIAEEWSTSTTVTENNVSTTTKTVLPYTVEMPYLIGANNANLYPSNGTGNQAKWYDNRGTDYCYYYATPIRRASETTFPLITGLDESKIDFGAIDRNSTDVRVIIEADVVQVNRYPQYWGIKALPWTGAVSATETTS